MTFELTIQEPPREHDRVEAWDDDPTPRGVVRAVLEAAIGYHWSDGAFAGDVVGDGCGHDLERWRRGEKARVRVLDLGAGFGAWSSEFARHWVETLGMPRDLLHITAIEINPERGPDLRKWADDVYIGDWRALLRVALMNQGHTKRGRGFDLVIGNPPFIELLRESGEFPRRDDGELSPERTMVPMLLDVAPAVLMLHTQQALLKSEMGRAVQRHTPPAAAWQVPGSVCFRGDGKADSRCYESTLWLRDHSGPCSRYLLDELDSSERKWTTPPGSESAAWAREHGYPLAPGVA